MTSLVERRRLVVGIGAVTDAVLSLIPRAKFQAIGILTCVLWSVVRSSGVDSTHVSLSAILGIVLLA